MTLAASSKNIPAIHRTVPAEIQTCMGLTLAPGAAGGGRAAFTVLSMGPTPRLMRGEGIMPMFWGMGSALTGSRLKTLSKEKGQTSRNSTTLHSA